MSGSTADIVNRLVRQLITAVTSTDLYSPEHPQTVKLREGVHAYLQEGLAGRNEILLMVVGDELVADGLVMEGGLHVDRIVAALKGRQIGHIKFLPGVTQKEVDSFIFSLSGRPYFSSHRQAEHIRIGRIELENAPRRREVAAVSEGVSPADMAVMQEFYDGIGKGKAVDARGISEMVTGFMELFQEQKDPLLALAPLRNLDEYTFSHSINVCILNLAQATALGMEPGGVHEIGVAGLLHDIGKLFISREIITKPGKLDEEEWQEMQTHPVKGARYLLQTPGIPRLAATVAFEHHMKYDFSGYPAVSPSWKQNLASQMTTLSDFFDALRTKRAYRNPKEMEDVAALVLDGINKEFHPTLARNFLLILSRMLPSPAAEG